MARLRTVHRAGAELRRGSPVLLAGAAPLVLLAAETAGPRGLDELAALTPEPPVLLLAPVRAASVLHRPIEQAGPAVALRLPEALLAPEALHSIADPTEDQSLPLHPETTTVPASAAAALELMKLARLLPAVLCAPAGPPTAEQAARQGILAVEADDVLAYRPAAAAGLRKVAEAVAPLELSGRHTDRRVPD